MALLSNATTKIWKKDLKAENIPLKYCAKMFYHLKWARVITLGISFVQYPSESIIFWLHFALTPSSDKLRTTYFLEQN